ncbi:DUF2243 domain-containing protein [Gracilibacillus kekensis]|uniref:Uncharacterized membrane protein n=1 Tax=Gracilibacillus kekensis TaxID=1027249 RepID=A0A1M7QHC9_9BACI|nr:DUF2243 domain-containing protein [Gracilibacillus kekensis]SHN30442.1 Uncharacterized membrane protein [Gracilibacillus kekensis]
MNRQNSSEKSANYTARNIWSGILFGLGIVAFIDETVFHQLLNWHHFYDRSTTTAGLFSDGLFHAFSWFATIAGLFLFADLRRREKFRRYKWWGGILLGGGIFQLYDGIIQHKIMRIHQIRYVDNIIFYDIIWNVIAILLIILGITLIRKRGNKKYASSSA